MIVLASGVEDPLRAMVWCGASPKLHDLFATFFFVTIIGTGSGFLGHSVVVGIDGKIVGYSLAFGIAWAATRNDEYC